jgi:hypothetical protein
MADGELKKGGVAGAGIGAILGGIVVIGFAVASAPLTAPVAVLTVVGVAAVGAIAGASTGK